MRIIAGSVKGRKLFSPKGRDVVRPALAVVREAIFSSLGDVAGLTILDVFAGTGSLGLEGLSRGAARAYFVDNHPQAIGAIIRNLTALGMAERGRVLRRRLPAGLAALKLDAIPDIVFCAPPYDRDLLNPTLARLLKYNLIDPRSIVIVEHTRREMPQVEGLAVVKERRYGQTLITYLKSVKAE
jgi:16S rRNA (guanine(966)-N(2))-methyltransferase RsmD